ncbi:MerR family transcriptional regulator [Cyanobacterium sp. IPPAS B-1200]|uniref:MerR family transcriptional regulator n=1 Tax=Cyanobacterium sp. IPPAS B-1200 TaxID=1562720 RepID=UPI0008526967|nr:MerR family transcriptional regulator [Cyanobacterium sp. IPPAS B-1200]OEJ79588.1 transcriptional regulator [Cyanobacterium sp. IPPAS B-1200]
MEQEIFFSSKDISRITGCSLRQLQYWRDKEVVVPFIGASGTGKTIYYSFVGLVEVSVMVYLLSVGLNLEMVQTILGDLRTKEPDFTNIGFKKRFMVVASDGTVNLLPYEREGAISLLEEGKAIVPLWIDQIHKNLI